MAPRFALRSFASVFGAFLLGVLGACTLVLDPVKEQCSTDADCVSRQNGFESTFCGNDHVCIQNSAYCRTNQECITHNGAGHFICRQSEHRCIDVLSPECSTLLPPHGALENDNVIILGALLSPRANPNFKAAEDSVSLMQSDFALNASGLPPGPGGGGRRPIAIVSCDPPPATPGILTAAKHLVNDVHVSALLGPIGSPDVLAVAQNVTIPNDVVLMAPSGTSELITNLTGRQGLIFRFGALDGLTATTDTLLVSQYIEPTLRAREVVAHGADLKLAVFHASTNFGAGIATKLFSQLRFNGKSPTENGANYVDIDYGDPAAPDASARQAAAIVKLGNEKPNIVILLGNTELGAIFKNSILPKESADFKPFYVSPVAPYPDILKAIPNEDVRKRVLGTISGPSRTELNFAHYIARYGGAFPGGDGVAAPISAAVMDAAYMVAYGVAANGDKPLTGRNLGKAIRRLVPPGTAIPPGPEGINDGLQMLAQGGNIDYTGVSSPCDFDENGDLSTDILVWCADPNLALTNRYKESGLYYDAKSNTLKGANNCSF